ncbi:MAG: hypothetical protein HYR55_01125 [Acidobacteria bacterium]|nr:hypothetical protein [Acidobacteriota bacterium]
MARFRHRTTSRGGLSGGAGFARSGGAHSLNQGCWERYGSAKESSAAAVGAAGVNPHKDHEHTASMKTALEFASLGEGVACRGGAEAGLIRPKTTSMPRE